MQSPFGDDFPEAAQDAARESAKQSMYPTPDDFPGPTPAEEREGELVGDWNASQDPDPDLDVTERARSLPVSLDFDGDQLASMLDELAADHTRRNLTEAAIRDKAISIVNTRAAARTAAREQRLAGGEVTSELDIRAEAVGASDDADVLRAFSRAFGAAAKQGDVLTAELVGLLPPRGDRPRRSFTVADGHGFDLKASSTPNTKVFAEMEVIADVIVASLVARDTRADGGESVKNPDGIRRYAEGLRDGIASILEVISSPHSNVKTTALDALGKQLQAMNEIDLAKRLAAAYGRKEHGEPTTKVERVPSKVAK
jgi:hypothetical protein